MTSSINVRQCDTSKPKCLELRNYTDEGFAKEIASEACITDKNSLIERFRNLRKSLENNTEFYNEVYPYIKTDKVTDGYNTPGKEIETLNQKFLDIQKEVNVINAKLGNTFKILQSFQGNLDVLTNCFILKRQLAIIQPGFCFVLMPTLVSATLFIFIVNLLLIGMTWGIFLAIKYAGDLGEKGERPRASNSRVGRQNQFRRLGWAQVHDVSSHRHARRRNRRRRQQHPQRTGRQ